MTDMLSRVDRAIRHARNEGRSEARATIEAMLTPTDFMMEAGLEVYGHNPDMPDEEVEQIWQVMVLAAMKEKQ